MNKRIRELAEQAEDWADSQNFYASDYRDYLMEKFAELIVRECAQFVFVLDAEPVSHKSAAKMLQEHFGVES